MMVQSAESFRDQNAKKAVPGLKQEGRFLETSCQTHAFKVAAVVLYCGTLITSKDMVIRVSRRWLRFQVFVSQPNRCLRFV